MNVAVGVQPMRVRRVGGYKRYEEQGGEDNVNKGESVESALKSSEMEVNESE